jgi:tetratricopeptide (TPR) repeat protein
VLGSVVGTFTAEALQGLTPGQRALTMLGVVPEWLRLLAWPAHLQADYSPREIIGAPGWGSAQTLGLTLLIAAALAVVATWRRMPVVAFGLLWLGISLFPVSNVLVPTGIVLAERALFLPSLGFLLVVGALAEGVQRELRTAQPGARWAAAAALGVLLLAGGFSSARRLRTWKDSHTQVNQLLMDAPLSYRAHFGIASLLWEDNQHAAAELEYRRALALFPRSYVVPRDLADHLRLEARCDEAIPLYQQTLANAPGLTEVRSSMIACLVYVGRYQDARTEALAGLARDGGGADSTNFRNFAATAERALLAETPAGTVRLTVVPQDTAASAR